MATTVRFPIGTKFLRYSRKTKETETVVDIHTTTNHAGDVVRVVYVCEHTFMGQTVTDSEVPEATIARSEVLS